MAADPLPDWAHLPQLQTIVFSESSLGLVAVDGRRFVLDRTTLRIEAVDSAAFAHSWPDAERSADMDESSEKDGRTLVMLHTSAGRDFKAQDADCEGDTELHHALWEGERPIQEDILPCHNIGAAEIVGDQLWLGTIALTEFEDDEASGLFILPLSGAGPTRSVGTKQGLSGSLIRVIRRDPYTKTTWVATQNGIDQLDDGLRPLLTRYFYEDFSAPSGRPTVYLDARPHRSDALAIVAREFAIEDTLGYWNAVRGLPTQIRSSISIVDPFYSLGNPIPAELNALLPFLLPSVRSPRRAVAWYTLRALCIFRDPRSASVLKEIEKSGSDLAEHARDCLDRQVELGWTDELERSERIASLLAVERAALEAIRRSKSPIDWTEKQNVITAAARLKRLRDPTGLQLINAHFAASTGGSNDSQLFASVMVSLYTEAELAPSALSGLGVVAVEQLGAGCYFFANSLEPYGFGRYDVRYAEAVLSALQRARAHEARGGTVPDGNLSPNEMCAKALASQLRNLEVREAFLARVYPALNAEQRQLVDPLLR